MSVERITNDLTVMKMGSSKAVVITGACKQMDLKVGDIVRVTIERLPQ